MRLMQSIKMDQKEIMNLLEAEPGDGLKTVKVITLATPTEKNIAITLQFLLQVVQQKK